VIGGEGRRNQAAYKLGRASDILEMDVGGGGWSRRGRAVFIVVEQSGKAWLCAPSPIGGPLNLRGQSSRTQIT